ncbi:hypothetical protein Tco_0222386, partial [Tanacetum coccineum]
MNTPITTSITDSQMHNNIMAASLRDHQPMLTTGRYAQWQLRFLRYIDTRPNGDSLRKCILEGPYTPSTVIILAVPATDDSPEVPERTSVEKILNMSLENKEHYQSKKEAIHLLLTGIEDEIYSTVDACKIAHLNDYNRFLQQLQLERSRFMTIVKQNHDLDTISYHKLFDVLKQNQNEVNEIRAERITKNENPLTLVAATQQYIDPYYQAPKSHKSYTPPSKQSCSTRSNASTKYKGKEIAKPIIPSSESASEEDNDLEQAQRDKDMQKNLALIAKYFKKIYRPTNNNLKTSSNTRFKIVDTFSRYKNDNQIGQFGNQMTVTVDGARETVGSQAEQADWLEETNEEIDEQELEAHYSYMTKIQEVPTTDSGTDTEPLEKVQYDAEYKVFANARQHSEQPESINNTCPVEKADSNVIPDSPDICNDDIQTDQNVEECEDKRVALANLIANLTLDTEENKNILKQLKKANASLTQELKECKSNLEEFNTTRDSCLIALQSKQTELETYKILNDRTVDYEKLERKLNETLGLLTQKEIDIKKGLKLKAYE